MAPRCIVELRWGKLAGTKVVIAPGASLRVGRGELADLTVSHDAQMSNVHFELAWDGVECRLRDLESAGGTLLAGERATEAVVPHGGWIRAGGTDFVVYVEGLTPPPDDDDLDDLDEDERVQRAWRREGAARALATLRDAAARSQLYSVLDAARDGRILVLLRESVEPHRSLYEGAEGERFEDVAPYLVGPLSADSPLLTKLVEEGWGKRWGIHCTSNEPFREVRRHFRRFLMAEIDDTGERVYFRFYDPEVLRTFHEVCTPLQRGQLLEGLERIWMDDDEGVSPFV